MSRINLQMWDFFCTFAPFLEGWKDDASLKAHSETPEFKKYVAEIEACGQMKLERFEF